MVSRFATSPCGPSAATAVPGTEPMKIQLPAEARGLPPLHPSPLADGVMVGVEKLITWIDGFKLNFP